MDDIQILPETYGDGIEFNKVALSNEKVLAEGCALSEIQLVVGENVYGTYGEKGFSKHITPYLDNY